MSSEDSCAPYFTVPVFRDCAIREPSSALTVGVLADLRSYDAWWWLMGGCFYRRSIGVRRILRLPIHPTTFFPWHPEYGPCPVPHDYNRVHYEIRIRVHGNGNGCGMHTVLTVFRRYIRTPPYYRHFHLPTYHTLWADSRLPLLPHISWKCAFLSWWEGCVRCVSG